MRTATWKGGPNDGAVVNIRDDCWHVMVAESPGLDWWREPAMAEVSLRTCAVPVVREFVVLADAVDDWPPCVVGWYVLDWSQRSRRQEDGQ